MRIDSRLRFIMAATLAVLSAVGLMTTSYLNAASFLVLLPPMFLFKEYRNKRHLLMFAAVCVAAGIIALRVLLYANPFEADVARPEELEGIARFLKLFWFNIGMMLSKF